MNKHKILVLLLAIILLSSTNTAFSAEAKRDKNLMPVSAKLKGGIEDAKKNYINADWWDRFNDPILKEYVIQSTTANHDMKIASLRVLETTQLVRESLGKELPSLGLGSMELSRKKTSNTVGMGSFYLPSYSQSTYTIPLSVNYELDLWRKNRQRTLQQAKILEAVKFDEKATYISLTTAVASAYLNAISLDKQIELQKEILKLREEIYEMTKANYEQGLLTAQDVITVDKALTEGETVLTDLQKKHSVFLNQLAVLTGQSSDDSSSLKRGSIDSIELPENIPSSIKSEIVQQRPDILKAEAEMQSAKINVELARKDLLPSIALTGIFGFNTNNYSKIFSWDSYIVSGGLNMLGGIFTGGQRNARLKAKKYQYEQMLESYQNTILTAFQEVNDALASLKYGIQKDENNKKRLRAEQNNFDLIEDKYKRGAISYLDTLQYKERVLSLEREKIQSKTECLVDALSLYKAVGGQL